MSSKNERNKIFVGNLPLDVRVKDIEGIFNEFGRILFVDLKNRHSIPYAFAFVKFEDPRDADDAVTRVDGRNYNGNRLRVEFVKVDPRLTIIGRGDNEGREQGDSVGSGSRRHAHVPHKQARRSSYRVRVMGLPPSGSWQDLKDHMRKAGDVCFADVYKDGTGVVEFERFADMRYAIKKLDDTKFLSHKGEKAYIRVKEGSPSPKARRRRSRSKSYSPIRHRKSKSISPHRSVSRSWSRSRSPN